MIDRILKTYGEVNTAVKHFPPENIKIFQLKIFIFYNLKNLCILHGRVFVMSCIIIENDPLQGYRQGLTQTTAKIARHSLVLDFDSRELELSRLNEPCHEKTCS